MPSLRLKMAWNGFKRAFVFLKTVFLGSFRVPKEAPSQWICAQAANILIVTSEPHVGLADADVGR